MQRNGLCPRTADFHVQIRSPDPELWLVQKSEQQDTRGQHTKRHQKLNICHNGLGLPRKSHIPTAPCVVFLAKVPAYDPVNRIVCVCLLSTESRVRSNLGIA